MSSSKTQANREILTYEPSGQEVRIHWNIEQKVKGSDDGSSEIQWESDEAICDYYDTRSSLIEKIINTEYPIGREIATINNKDTEPSEYQEYQDFRAYAKTLADGWIQQRSATS